MIGFIILRHVNTEKSNRYWQECHNNIRIWYPNNPIVVIDDNSNPTFLGDNVWLKDKELINTTLIQSEYPGRGELLPYYYYAKEKFFDTAVIIHDSVIINKYFDFSVEKYKILWSFLHINNVPECETAMMKHLSNHEELLTFYNNQDLWRGCFGCMSVIKHEYLKELDNKYCFSNLLNYVLTRNDRMYFERVIACMLQINSKPHNFCLLGDIHAYCLWGIPFDFIEDFKHLPIIKYWSGR